MICIMDSKVAKKFPKTAQNQLFIGYFLFFVFLYLIFLVYFALQTFKRLKQINNYGFNY